FETLNVRTKCGFKSASRQMRCTLEWLMPTAFAIDRVLQCVAFGGGCIVVVSTFSFTSADSGFLREGRVLSRRRPSTPVSMYRSCQRHTHGFDLLVSRIIALVPSPSAVASTILACSCYCDPPRCLQAGHDRPGSRICRCHPVS